jgi:pilus assembly protein CpaB
MQGGRTLIIVGVVILVLVLIVGAVLFVSSNLLSPPAPEPTAVPTEEAGNGDGGEETAPGGTVQIVVAAQNIPRGTRITADNNAVKVMAWPKSALPEGTLVEITTAYDRIVRQDIPIDMPITEGMLTNKPGDMAEVGSDAALLLPPGRVAFAMPMARWSSVAWAVQPGDRVDVLISILVVDLDQDFQTELPNLQMSLVPVPGTGETEAEGEEGTAEEQQYMTTMGRLEALPDGTLVMALPGETWQRPRLVTQMVVQDAMVLHIGDWDMEVPEVEAEPPAPTPEGTEETPGEDAECATPEPRPVLSVPFRHFKSVTLGIVPQDAVVLKYLNELGVSIDLVVRSASDAGDVFTTEAVTLDYVFERYSIEVPPKLPYGPSNPIYDLNPLWIPRRQLDNSSVSGDVRVEVEGQVTIVEQDELVVVEPEPEGE